MGRVQVSRRYPMDRRRLFELSEDLDARVCWDDQVEAIEFVEPWESLEVGARVDVIEPDGGRMATRYTAFDPPDRIEVQMVGGYRMFADFVGEWAYRNEHSAGAPPEASLTITYQYRLARPWSLIGPVVGRVIARRLAQKLAMLDVHVAPDAGPPTAGRRWR